ncbi:unnamed protein product [marine sediment metagenome]|uniref:Uncharacterized protein n=1 Tax=marine sediment metagenome TaxID=412755 RepID=X1HJM0_9ZZZZ
MVQKVKIRKGERNIKVHFIYNTDLIDIMRSHRGWWFKGEKCWQLPLWKLEPLYDELTDKHYKVEIVKLIEEPKKPKPKQQYDIDYWADKDVMSVWGECKKCGRGGFVGKNELCARCK